MKASREAPVLRACLELLRLYRIPAWRINSGAFVLGTGAARRFFRAGAVGMSDIVGLLPPDGRWLSVETKRPGGRLTASQAAFLDSVRAAGGLAVCVSSDRQLEDALREEGVIL